MQPLGSKFTLPLYPWKMQVLKPGSISCLTQAQATSWGRRCYCSDWITTSFSQQLRSDLGMIGKVRAVLEFHVFYSATTPTWYANTPFLCPFWKDFTALGQSTNPLGAFVKQPILRVCPQSQVHHLAMETRNLVFGAGKPSDFGFRKDMALSLERTFLIFLKLCSIGRKTKNEIKLN